VAAVVTGPLALGLAVGLLAAAPFLPMRALRALAALWLGAAAALVAPDRRVGALAGLAVAAAAVRWLPARVARRVAWLAPSLVLLVFATCVLMYLAPGSPFAGERVAAPQVEAALRAQYGVPEGALAFFGVYVERLALDGSLGPSLRVQGRGVADLLAPAIPVSLGLGLLALALAVGTGVALGVVAALRPRSWLDRTAMAIALVGISVPSFVLGAAGIVVFSLGLGWLPVAGFGSWRHLVLPALTLAAPYAATVARLARAGMLEVLALDFVRTARAKGLPERSVVLRHALPGALLPVVSYLAPAAAGILTGSFVVETLFGVPGMGQWFVKGAINRDYTLVLGTALVYAALVAALNLAADLLYAWLDPRVRESA
jgi:oligopeptide transport system permease protein